MPQLHFRLPARTRSISEWLALLLPSIDRAARRQWIEGGRVRVEGIVVERPGQSCRPGTKVVVEIDSDFNANSNTNTPAQGISDAVFAPDGLLPALPPQTSGTWTVWVDEPPWFGGRLELESAQKETDPAALVSEILEFVVEERSGGLARLSLAGAACTAEAVCAALAEAGMPVVGDLVRGGLARAEGVAIAATQEQAAAIAAELLAAPDPVWPAADSTPDDRSPLQLRVSQEAARALDRGHPWVLPDEASESATRFAPGSLLRVEARDGRVLGWGWAEGTPRLAVRMAQFGDVEVSAIASIESRVARALARRRGLLVASAAGMPERTDCFRLIHGEGDDLPGLFVDRVGPLLRVLVTGRASDGFRERAIAALRAQLPTTPEGVPWSVIELLHLRDAAGSRTLDRVRWIEGSPDVLSEAGVECVGEGFWVEERGLRFSVDPGWDSVWRTRAGFGLFPDQRENRERLVGKARQGGRWLNLFAHTGAFSAGLLAAGAREVVSVDLSAPYLARLEANLEANRERGVDPSRHRSIRGEGRRIVESFSSTERFDGIVLDPPTAAAAGRRYWSVRRDLEPLLRTCLGQLEAGGCLLVTQNGRGTTLGLDQILERFAARAKRSLRSLVPAPPSEDHPSLAGFPEGDAFEGWLLELD